MARGGSGAGGAGALPAIIASVTLAGVAAGLSRLALARYVRYDLEASVVLVSSLTTWFMAARAFSAVASGYLADRAPGLRAALMYLPMLGIALLVYLVSGLRDPYLVLVVNAFWGLLSGMVWPLTQTVTSLLARGRSGLVMSLYFTLAFLGMVGGQYLYGVLPLDNPGVLRVSGFLFAAAGLGLALASRMVDHGSMIPRRGRRGLGGLRGAGGLGGLTLWILFAAFAVGYGSGLLKEFLYIYLPEVHGLDRAGLSSVLAAAGVLALAAGFAVGPAADRLGVGPVLAAVLAAGVAGELLLATPSLALAFAGLVLASLAARSSLPLTRNAAFLGSAYAATMVGLSNTLNNLGQMTSPMIAGVLYEKLGGRSLAGLPGASTPFLVAALVLALALLLYPLARRSTAPVGQQRGEPPAGAG